MSAKRILCNPKDPKEMEIWVKAAIASMKCSSYNMTLGEPTSIYFDVDEFILGRKNEDGIYNSRENAPVVKRLVKSFINLIKRMEKECAIKFDKIAFIDKGGGGPVGMVSFLGVVAANASKDIVLVRPKKRLINASIKGNLKRGENVLLISDVATSGASIYLAAKKIWQFGGKVPCSLVWVDRDLGARENLDQYAITLYSIIDRKSLAASSKELRNALKKDTQEKSFINFGVGSLTSIYSSPF